ncbi:hypothetical protein PACTADRAFT_74106 [Pachysolen tannophilus NRRL Y-2460]|uniref:PRA1 family protein n=1 Tax=Pachysolen tannophilus NRRL Y-2460 TaxID=669874 RepID=A0A1E4U3I6_PACTA|nr:hypothetical protein PACTADRAFT_74106 [Pachysolen tannophilus NRRL Y-2460]
MASFVPAQFSSFSSNFNFNSLRADNISNLQSRLHKLKPPQDFLDIKRISRPRSANDVQQRIAFNLNYFSSNYLLILLVLLLYSLFTNFWLLFDVVFVISSCYGISKLNGNDLNLGFVRLNQSQLYTGVAFIGLPVLFISSPIATIFWLISVSSIIVLGHAAIMDKPIETAFNDVV